MRFTDSPFEKMMQQIPKQRPPAPQASRPGTRCKGCPYWNGAVCIGVCYRELVITSGQHGPKSEE